MPALRDGDDNFFGVEGRVRVTVSLPTGALEVGGVTARYERGGSSGPGSFLICVEVKDGDDPAAAAWATFFRGHTTDDCRGDE